MLLKNWETAPISEIALFPGNSSCPEPYSELALPVWPGASSSACACEENARTPLPANDPEYSSKSSCDTNQTQAGCLDQSAVEAVALEDWRESTICFRREGVPQLISATKLRPIPSRSGVCPGGWAACGEGTYDRDRAVCVPLDASSSPPRCPLVDAKATDGEAPGDPELAATGASQAFLDGSGRLLWTRDGSEEVNGEMPLNQLEISLQGDKRGYVAMTDGRTDRRTDCLPA